MTGHGGDIATVFRDYFKCRLLPANFYSSFVLQLFVAELPQSVLFPVVYCPPKYNKDFIERFSELLVASIPRYDKLLRILIFMLDAFLIS